MSNYSDFDLYVKKENLLNEVTAIDGSGSAIDADLLDGLNSDQIVRTDISGILDGRLTLNDELLTAIDTTVNANTVVDIFIYDTSKDSDGGAWRKRTQNTSWYNETLNTATRGSTKEFPAVALIVAEFGIVTIYDATDSTCPMWMIFNSGSFIDYNEITSVAMVNGLLITGSDSGTTGILRHINFVSDYSTLIATFGHLYKDTGYLISQRNILGTVNISLDVNLALANDRINDIAVTVLPGAPIDSATGLPIPTIAVATNGGVSVIHNDFSVADITSIWGYEHVNFISDNRLWLSTLNGSNDRQEIGNIPTVNVDYTVWVDNLYTNSSTPNLLTNATFQTPITYYNYQVVFSNFGGMSLIYENASNKSDGMINYITKDYQSGWMQGDIKGAFLANSKTADRSVNNNPLTENGTVTESPVATGSELMAYSGFGSGFLQQAYNSDLDFGTDDFYIMGWFKGITQGTNSHIIDRHLSSNVTSRIVLLINASGFIQFQTSATNASTFIPSDFGDLSTRTDWFFICARRYANGTMSITVDDKTVSDSSLIIKNVTNASAVLNFGRNLLNAGAMTGSMSLLRIGAGAPSDDQLKEIYESERKLFQENAACTLSSTTDSSIQALAYDDDTELLHVAGTDNLDTFDGLVRVDSEVGAYTSLSASNGMLIKGN